PSAVEVRRRVASAWAHVAEKRGAAAHLVEIVDVERYSSLARHRHEVQHRVGGAAGRGHAGDGVVYGGSGEDGTWSHAAAEDVHHQLATLSPDVTLAGVLGRHTRRAHG